MFSLFLLFSSSSQILMNKIIKRKSSRTPFVIYFINILFVWQSFYNDNDLCMCNTWDDNLHKIKVKVMLCFDQKVIIACYCSSELYMQGEYNINNFSGSLLKIYFCKVSSYSYFFFFFSLLFLSIFTVALIVCEIICSILAKNDLIVEFTYEYNGVPSTFYIGEQK